MCSAHSPSYTLHSPSTPLKLDSKSEINFGSTPDRSPQILIITLFFLPGEEHHSHTKPLHFRQLPHVWKVVLTSSVKITGQ